MCRGGTLPDDTATPGASCPTISWLHKALIYLLHFQKHLLCILFFPFQLPIPFLLSDRQAYVYFSHILVFYTQFQRWNIKLWRKRGEAEDKIYSYLLFFLLLYKRTRANYSDLSPISYLTFSSHGGDSLDSGCFIIPLP